MKKTFISTLILISLPVLVFAGTIFEDDKKTSDPFVADRGGFNSMFINPAGTAGQSGFELAISVGGRSTSNDIKLLMGITDMAMAMADSGGSGATETESIADASQSLSDLYDSGVINDALLDSLFDTTALDPALVDWSNPAAVQAAAESLTTGAGSDMETIENNLQGVLDGTNVGFYTALDQTVGDVDVSAVASLKTGLLIKGFGLGIYDQAVGVAYMDAANQEYGLETVYNELGVVGGFGFNLLEGKLALGMSGNYGVLMKNTSPVPFDSFDTLINTSINYGYNWGVDLGAIWRPTPALGVGVVFNDVIGYTEADTPRTAAGIEGFMAEKAFFMDTVEYQVTLDLDAGISWQPDWRFVRPKLGLDLYNVVGYGRAVADNGDNFKQAMYRSLEHVRVGAQFVFFDFLKVGAQYYNHYLSAGAGLDLLFLELYGEVKMHDQAVNADSFGDVPVGADLTVRLHF